MDVARWKGPRDDAPFPNALPRQAWPAIRATSCTATRPAGCRIVAGGPA
jgi:hypothetical protein